MLKYLVFLFVGDFKVGKGDHWESVSSQIFGFQFRCRAC